MNIEYNLLYEKAFKKFTLGVLYIVVFSYILGAIFYPLPYPINYFFLAGAVLNAMPIALVHTLSTEYMKKVIRVYAVIVIIPLYGITIACLLKGIITTLFWYFSIPVCLYTFFPGKQAIKCAIISLCLLISSFIVALTLHYFVNNNSPIIGGQLSLFHQLLTEMFNSILSLTLMCYSLYYIYYFSKLKNIKNKDIINLPNDRLTTISESIESEDDKYDLIYDQIIEYLETRQPYLNPDFRIVNMANDLNINTTYLARSFKKNKFSNFNNLINYYRIEKVKELIDNNTSKYTLEYIYISSGFKSQSSFNRAFKSVMNTTPSEYYKQAAEGLKNHSSENIF